jgi:hypothetical protein
MANQPDCRIRCECVSDSSQFAWRPPVVPIQERNDLSPRFRDPSVESGSLSPIGFAQQAHTGLEPPDKLGGVVGRAVVHDENLRFRRWKTLVANATNRFLDKRLVIVGVN